MSPDSIARVQVFAARARKSSANSAAAPGEGAATVQGSGDPERKPSRFFLPRLPAASNV